MILAKLTMPVKFAALPLLLFLGTLVQAQSPTAGPAASAPYLNPQLPIDVRVDDLVSRMTLEEKASQLVNQARAIPRLNVPEYDYWSEGLHGVAAAGIATVFPQAIALGATWDAPLLHDVAIVIGTEARAKHHEAVRQGRHNIFEGLTFWSPNINIFRDPRWGRGQETYGEDPFLTGRMGIAFVTGLQGDNPRYLRVVSTPKHFAVHSGPESTRHKADVQVSKHDEEDTYLPAFRATIVDGRAASTMCAYNSINGEPACANTFLLEDTLRGDWRFNGFVVSDCGAVLDIWSGHHYTKTKEEAAAISLKRGMDNECVDFTHKLTDNSDYVKYIDAVKQGYLSEKDIDIAVRRLFRARFMLGMFDPPEMVPYAQIPYSENDTELHRQLSLKTSRETMVLLKNDGILPLVNGPKNIAVVGPLADNKRVLEGNYNGTPSRATSALEGIKKQFATSNVSFVPGTHFLRDPKPVPPALFTTPDGQPGLKAEYFKNKELSGAPAVTRVDKSIDFNFIQQPIPGFSSGAFSIENFSARWTGFFTPNESGSYQLGMRADDGFRLWLDGKMLVEDWTIHGISSKLADVKLEKGHKYALKVEYFQNTGDAIAQIVWNNELAADPLNDAVSAAKNADLVIAVVGITSDLEGEEMNVQVEGFQGGDRTSLDLPKEEEQLLEAVKATGKPLVVVLMNGSALSVNWADKNANAILEAWYSGEEGGTAIADTLAGVNNPSGRLPLTFYTGVSELPPFDEYRMTNRTYRYFTGKPLYPFGHGLSYSKFEYSNLKLSAPQLQAGDPLRIDADVKNNSQRDGDEVVEVYLTFPNVAGAPLRALRGFTRVHVAAGETAHVRLNLNPRDLSMVDEAGNRIVAPGSYSLSVGGGQPGTAASVAEASFSINGKLALPE
ncbi:MAG TPA: glycoside hydrolase family 3 C-terminal domain-containing protein [Candidatus Acidoferrum sp.]|nr:glycoside hydrolase family 3 C-terminal domain-containing protein [Candidatus Acidoferrum sp.]